MYSESASSCLKTTTLLESPSGFLNPCERKLLLLSTSKTLLNTTINLIVASQPINPWIFLVTQNWRSKVKKKTLKDR